MQKMDKIHRKILAQLLTDCRQPISKIAKTVGVTRQTVSKKIGELKEWGIIDSFSVKLNPDKFGLTTKAYVLLREDPRAEIRRKNEERIKEFHQVSEFYRLFGRYDAVLEVTVKDSKELIDLIKQIHALEGVKETETLIVHSTIKDNPQEPFLQVLVA